MPGCFSRKVSFLCVCEMRAHSSLAFPDQRGRAMKLLIQWFCDPTDLRLRPHPPNAVSYRPGESTSPASERVWWWLRSGPALPCSSPSPSSSRTSVCPRGLSAPLSLIHSGTWRSRLKPGPDGGRADVRRIWKLISLPPTGLTEQAPSDTATLNPFRLLPPASSRILASISS